MTVPSMSKTIAVGAAVALPVPSRAFLAAGCSGSAAKQPLLL